MPLPIPSEMTAAVGAILTAAQWNSNVRDGINFLLAPPIAVVYQITAQSIANSSNTQVNFDGSVVDSYSGHSNSSNNARYFAQVAGWYLVIGSVTPAASATGRRVVRIQVNGASVTPDEVTILEGGADALIQQAAGLVFLNVGDFVNIAYLQTSGGSMTLGGAWMAVLWVHS